jgi:two-component system, NarL family, nitrate/nitrite response regulator NarL
LAFNGRVDLAQSNADIRTTLVLVEDNADLSATVQAFLAQEGEFQLLGAASDSGGFQRLIEAHLPDLALIDIGLDTPRTGLELLEWLAVHYPVVKPIIMTVNRGDVLEAYERGARGYVLKTHLEHLAPTLREVGRGEVIIPPGVGALFVQQMATQTAHYRKRLELLQMSEREREILTLLKQEVDRETIAERLHISYFTVRRHIQNILEKTGEGSVRDVLRKFGEVLGGTGPNRG